VVSYTFFIFLPHLFKNIPPLLNGILILKTMNDPKIEYLNSEYKDSKIETVKPISQSLMRFLNFYFSTVGLAAPKIAVNFALTLFTTPRIRAVHTRTDAVIDSAEKKIVTIENNTIMTYQWGNFEKTILLAHGWESRGTALRMFVKPLNTFGFSVLAFDAPAHGGSSGKTCSLPQNAFVISELLKQNNVCGIIAHSFGCACSMYAIQFYAQKYTPIRMAFMAVPPKPQTILEGFLNRIKISARLKQSVISKILSQYPDLKKFDPALSEGSVSVEKLLIIQDSTDDVTPVSVAKNIIAHWKKAHLIISEGYGHYRLAKNPDVVKRIVQFLTA